MSMTQTHPQPLALRGGRVDVVAYDGVLRIERLSSVAGYVLSGEVDASTYDALAAALRDLDTGGEVHLDLTALRFCDAPGFGTMIGLTEHADRVVLHGVPAVLCRLLSIVGWDTIPNLVVHPRTDSRTDSARP